MSDVVNKLIQILEDDLRWHQDLAAVLENKLDAMRHYDLSRLEALSANEQRLTTAIASNEPKRRAVIREATNRFSPQRNTPLTARELAGLLLESRPEGADRVGRRDPEAAEREHAARRLTVLTDMLRDATEKIKRLNNVVAIASNKILGHFDHIFQIIARSGRDIGLYGRGGKKSLLDQNRLVDALA